MDFTYPVNNASGLFPNTCFKGHPAFEQLGLGGVVMVLLYDHYFNRNVLFSVMCV